MGWSAMKTIGELLKAKGRTIWSITPEASVYEAIELMADKGIGALIVLNAGQPAGMVSERDYARKVILKGRHSKETTVSEIMTSPVIFSDTASSVEECMELMTVKHIRHLPVLEDGQLAGVVSIGDLVKAIISEQQFMIEQLESYISG
jgi:CBS domain-containing protein